MTASAADTWRRGDTCRLPEVTLFCGLCPPVLQQISFVMTRRQSHRDTVALGGVWKA